VTFGRSPSLNFRFERIGVPLKPRDLTDELLGTLNPACARLRDGTLQLYPRMVAPGNISRIGSFRVLERPDGKIDVERVGYALEPSEPYELRDAPGGYGCEDPRVTFIPALDRYVMAYVAFGQRGPEVAVAISSDGLAWQRLGPMHFAESDEQFADKDAAFFPEPIRSPNGVQSLAFYHRPTLNVPIDDRKRAIEFLENLPPEKRDAIAIGYVTLDAVRADISKLCDVAETHRLAIPDASWGAIKVGAGTPPVRIAEGWMAVIHGVDELKSSDGETTLRYCAGIIIHDAERPERVIYRSKDPILDPELPDEVHGIVGNVVFPTGIDGRGERAFDIYYGMADYEIGRGRLTLEA
jgi:beta-1,2-mannobiose phosphorylase / 1,2-beta-oligomannan phosphorylase